MALQEPLDGSKQTTDGVVDTLPSTGAAAETTYVCDDFEVDRTQHWGGAYEWERKHESNLNVSVPIGEYAYRSISTNFGLENSTSGLPRYFKRGDVGRCYMRFADTDDSVFAQFASQGGNNFYECGVKNSSKFAIRKRNGGGSVWDEAKGDHSVSAGQWYFHEIVWKDDDTIEAELFDMDGNSLSDRISDVDPTFSNVAAIGMRSNSVANKAYCAGWYVTGSA